MQSTLGKALEGRYTIDREIGRGGMATVYLARDVRHNRKVALKVLNPELGAVLGVGRFLAEIEVTANLQHPNLLPLFDSGEVEGLLFYVMPYVEGESLRVRLEREKQLPVAEAVRIASAIAGALDYAHRHHVIHRDLKPENILMHEGQPLIADFGIALAVSNAGGSRITQTGLSLGTPQYMSPEQATGDRAVDGRTDIYSLGAMTYEMLVGDPPYVASTSQAIIAKVLTERPASVRMARPTTPPHVEATVARALEKLAADRFATAKEFADALEGKGAPLVSSAVYAAPAPAVDRASRARAYAPWALVALLAAALAWMTFAPLPAVEEHPVVRANFDLPPGVRVREDLVGPTIAVSPKGDMIAFTAADAAGFRMYVRRVNEAAPRHLIDAAGRNLAFSPNGRWLAYTEGNVLYKISVDGGAPSALSSAAGSVPYGLSWSTSDTIYMGGFSGLWAVPASGGTAQVLATTDSARARLGRRWPLVLPDGKAIVYATGDNSAAPPRLGVISTDGTEIQDFDLQIAMPLGVMGELLVYVAPSGDLMAVPFSVSERRPTGDPVVLDAGVLVDPTAGVKASLSQSGTLAFLRGRALFHPVIAEANTATSVALIADAAAYSSPRFSPRGDKVAITLASPSATDIYVYDVALNTLTRVTTEGVNIRPEWTQDGRHVIFISTRANKPGIWKQPADGSGAAELLYQPADEPFEALMSPDMKWLVYRTAPGARNSRDIMAVPLTGTQTVVPIATGPTTTESLPRISPDGKWIAYQSNETSRFQVYVRPFPGNGARTQVSDVTGTEPVWGRSGTSLYYRGPNGEVVEVAVTTGAAFSIGARKVVLEGEYLTDASHANWDVSPAGKFLMLKRAGAQTQTIVVHNWGRELREKTAPRR